jgi:hypothetical protein
LLPFLLCLSLGLLTLFLRCSPFCCLLCCFQISEPPSLQVSAFSDVTCSVLSPHSSQCVSISAFSSQQAKTCCQVVASTYLASIGQNAGVASQVHTVAKFHLNMRSRSLRVEG